MTQETKNSILIIGGGLIGCVAMALMMANAGGAWDNAKKYIEDGNYGGKGTPIEGPNSTTRGPNYSPIKPKTKDKNKFPKGPWCTVGDHVCYGKHTGQKLFYQGQRFILIFDDQILMRVDSPQDLDPTFNLSH